MPKKVKKNELRKNKKRKRKKIQISSRIKKNKWESGSNAFEVSGKELTF